MAKHWSGSLRTAAVSVGLLAACSEQAAVSSGQGGAGGMATVTAGAGGSLGAVPVVTAGTAGATAPSAGAGGSAAGSAGAAGSLAAAAGSAGGPSVTPYVPPVSKVMCPPAPVGGMAVGIADFDEGLDVLGVDGRGGIWFGYSDGTGKQTDSPIPVVESGVGGNGKAMHVEGGGYKNWGSGIGSAIAFDFQKNAQCPYDASAFSGLRLKVKGEGSVRLRITQVATTPATATDRYGTCDPNKATCDGHHEVTITLTEEWAEHAYAWADFKQLFGKLVDFDAKSIIGVSFEFNSGTMYDLWVDDIAFTRADEGGEGGAGAGGASVGGAGAE